MKATLLQWKFDSNKFQQSFKCALTMEIVTKHKPTIHKYTRSRMKHITQVFNVEKTLSGKKLHQEKRSSCIIFTKGDYKYIHFLCPSTFTLVEPGYL